MISHLNGTVLHSSSQFITVSLGQLAIGFDVYMPNAKLISVGSSVSIFIYMHWNQDQGPSLYGFLNQLDKQISELVISCSGIGPKIGLALLEQMQPSDFIKAISTQDIKALSNVNGIGAKKAEQIIVQLKHKITPLLESGFAVEDNNLKHIKNISEVLGSLNYSRPEISSAIDYLKHNCSEGNHSFDQMLRNALSFLSKRI